MYKLYTVLDYDKHIEYGVTFLHALKEAGYEFAMAETTYIPQNTVELTNEKDIKNMENLIDMLEDHDDVQEVYHNWDMPEEE